MLKPSVGQASNLALALSWEQNVAELVTHKHSTTRNMETTGSTSVRITPLGGSSQSQRLVCSDRIIALSLSVLLLYCCGRC